MIDELQELKVSECDQLPAEYWLAVTETQKSVRLMWLAAMEIQGSRWDADRPKQIAVIMSRLVGILELANTGNVMMETK